MERIGKYRIQRLVARGGMGALYLALDPDLDREVAIKVMSDDIVRDEQARARFYREAKAAARLQHRNIVTVYDFAHDGDIPYFVMEFLRGQNLSQRMRHGPPLTLQMKVDLAIQLCEGLHFAHGEGVIHRDVKPANIWLLGDGGVKLLDFGIAKSSTSTLTLGSSVVGTAGYMSPEQIEGQPVDARSDLFSVGAVLFELIAGRPPFDGDSVTAVMMKIVQDEPAPDLGAIVPDAPVGLASAVSRALEKAPDDRYADAAQLAADLRAVRLEIAEQEEQIEALTLIKNASDLRATPFRSEPPEAAPGPASTLPMSRLATPSEVVPHDYMLHSVDQVPPPGPTADALEKGPDDRCADATQSATDLRAARVEIAKQEEQTDAPTLVKDASDPRKKTIRSGPSEAAPRPAWTRPVSHPATPPEVVPPHDYMLRSPEEVPSPASTAGGEHVRKSRKTLWLGAAVVALVSVAALVAARPDLFFGNSRSPQIRITSAPNGAKIFVNGIDTGLRTPAEVHIARLPASVQLELAGFEPFVTEVTEQIAKATDASIGASLVELAAQPPPPTPAPAEPTPTPTPPPPALPRPLAELKVLRAPGAYAFCSASIGRSWSGYPFDGLTSIKLPAQRYPIRIECSGQPPSLGEIQVPPGKNERNFNEVVTLKPLPDSAVQP